MAPGNGKTPVRGAYLQTIAPWRDVSSKRACPLRAQGASLFANYRDDKLPPDTAFSHAKQARDPTPRSASTRDRTARCSLRLLDVPLGGRAGMGGTWITTRDQDKPLELGDEHPILVVDARVHLDSAAVGLCLGLALLQPLGLAEQ